MKHIIVIAILLSTTFTMYPMNSVNSGNNDYDEIPLTAVGKTRKAPSDQETHQLYNKNATIISDLIDKKNPIRRNLAALSFTVLMPDLPETTAIDILKTNSDITLDKTLIELLYERNFLFEEAIRYCTSLALDDIKTVTASTLRNIENPQLQQKNEQLNELPLIVKEYVMQKAQSQIEHSYQIPIAIKRTSINCVKLFEKKHLAAIVCTNSGLHVWDLQNASEILSCERITTAQEITFDPAGRYIAVLSNDQVQYTVREYDLTNPKKPPYFLHTTENVHGCSIKYASFKPAHKGRMLSIICQSADIGNQQYFALRDENDNHTLSQAYNLPFIMKRTAITKLADFNDTYSVNCASKAQGKNLTILKTQNCQSLYLCEKAIHNTADSDTLDSVTSSATYQKLTPLEQSIVTTALNKKQNLLQSLTENKETS